MIAYTICHNDDDRRDPNHRRVPVETITLPDREYAIMCDGYLHDSGTFETEQAAERAILTLWGDPVWDLRQVPMTAAELRGRLAEMGWTQRHLGKILGVSDRTVSRWATGNLPVPAYCQRYLAPPLYTQRRHA